MATIDLKALLMTHSDIIELMIKKNIIPLINSTCVNDDKKMDATKVLIAQDLINYPTLKLIVEGKHFDVIKMLLTHKLIKNLEEKYTFYNRTLLLVAAEAKQFEIVQLLLEQGANINAESELHYTALTYAVNNNDVPMIKFLFNKGANPNIGNLTGGATLTNAADSSTPEIIQLLIDNGANVDFQNSCKNTALCIASMHNKPAIVKILLDAGANLDIKNDDGNDALFCAKNRKCREIITMIKEAKNKRKCTPEKICKNTNGDVYPVLVPKHLVCHAIYRVDPNENAPNTRLVAITDDDNMAQTWTNGEWTDKKLSTKNLSVQLPTDKLNKVDYHVVAIDGVEVYVKFGADLKITSGVLGDIYRC